MNVLNLLGYLASFVLGCVVVYVFKPFLGSYSAKKGENLATKEDIRELTKTAEEIKAQISGDVWDRQKQWEMKRDVVFDVVRALGVLNRVLFDMAAASDMPIPEKEDSRSRVLVNRIEVMARWKADGAIFDGAKFLSNMVVGNELRLAISSCRNEMLKISNGMTNKTAKYDKASHGDLARRIEAVYAAVRAELQLADAE